MAQRLQLLGAENYIHTGPACQRISCTLRVIEILFHSDYDAPDRLINSELTLMNIPHDSAEKVAQHNPHEPPHTRHQEHPPHPDPNLVSVTLNRNPVTIRRGQYTGAELKAALGVPVDHELDLVVNGEFKPIANEDKHHVRGGEVFVSQVGQGQSS